VLDRTVSDSQLLQLIHNYPSYWLSAKRCRLAEVGPMGTKLPTEVHPEVLIEPLIIGLIVLIEPSPGEAVQARVLALVRDRVGLRRPTRYAEKVEHAP
jgi:hypothetical protein